MTQSNYYKLDQGQKSCTTLGGTDNLKTKFKVVRKLKFVQKILTFRTY